MYRERERGEGDRQEQREREKETERAYRHCAADKKTNETTRLNLSVLVPVHIRAVMIIIARLILEVFVALGAAYLHSRAVVDTLYHRHSLRCIGGAGL